MNLVIDYGNTLVKAAVFSDDEMVFNQTEPLLQVRHLRSILKEFNISCSIVSSVIFRNESIYRLLEAKSKLIDLNFLTPVPVLNHYKTPETLGTDRIANLTGATFFFPAKNVLVISAGTCITYDVITSDSDYYGGNITPGLDMRLRSLNTFTARLPLVKKEKTKKLVGTSTSSSILTGVIQGTINEMNGLIKSYRKMYPRLQIVLTGGDTGYFERTLEYKIFAAPHLALYGLNEILRFNHA